MGELAGQADRPTDGRALRRVRSQDAVVEAILDLLAQGQAQPTALQVSQRAGISMRSIFRLFDDMEALHAVAIVRQAERITPMLRELPTDGPLARRIDALVRSRAEIFETITPARRLGNRLADTSPTIRDELARFGRFFRAQLAAVFAAELPDRPNRAVHLDALDAATSWEAWERLRARQGLSGSAARRAMALTVKALVTTTAKET